ncbi:hypothetical protein J6590_075355 [Homalodisca vitripennis]|nr:hypothetical protein J6590_075355 [Homalodisca vitripennis]
MPRHTSVFKKVKNKGNKYYRSKPFGPITQQSDVLEQTEGRPSSQPRPSSSRKKLSSSGNKCYEDVECESQNIIISVDILNAIVSNLGCKSCGGKWEDPQDLLKSRGREKYVLSGDDTRLLLPCGWCGLKSPKVSLSPLYLAVYFRSCLPMIFAICLSGAF